MRPLGVLLLVAALCGPGLGLGTVSADGRDAGGSWCDQNPSKCADMKQRREQYCRKNPQGCETSAPRRDHRGGGGHDRRDKGARQESRRRRD